MTPETKRTFKVAVTLCLICSVVVSALAVGLKSIQEEQKEAFRQQSILSAAGLWTTGGDPGQLFKDNNVAAVGIDLEDYKPESGDLSQSKFDMSKSLQNPDLNRSLDSADDLAGLKKIEKYSVVYEIKADGKVKTLVLPIRGKGLWSTLYGFIALDLDDIANGPQAIKVAGLTYYKHGETPGLGGEVDNELWKSKWRPKYDNDGKLTNAIYPFDKDWNVIVEVSKSATTNHQVDAISGATLTSNGVSNMLQFWLGKNGFGPFIKNLAASASQNEPTEAAVISNTTPK